MSSHPPRTRGRPDPANRKVDELNCEPVTLDVRGRPFFTTIGTLVQRNKYFAALLSGRWNVPKQEDGSIFIDSDPDVFAHILVYLSNGVFPLAYNPDTGHDINLYLGILTQARFYIIPELVCWLENACYRKAISLVVTMEPLKELHESPVGTTSQPAAKEIGKGFDMVQIMPWKTEMTPTWHYLDTIKGAGPLNTRDEQYSAGEFGTEEKTSFVVLRKKVLVDHKWCTATGYVLRRAAAP